MVQADKQLFIKVTASNTRQMFHDEMTWNKFGHSHSDHFVNYVVKANNSQLSPFCACKPHYNDKVQMARL